MNDFDALLKAVKTNPDDDTPRLVLADWLEENGSEADKARAEFIRVSCELGVTPMSSDRWRELYSRSAGLLAQHQAEWTENLPASSYSFDRGFLKIDVPMNSFIAFGNTKLNPYVTHMDIRDPNRQDYDPAQRRMLPKEALNHLSGLSHLGFRNVGLGNLFSKGLARIEGLKSFAVKGCQLAQPQATKIGTSKVFENVTRLEIDNDLTGESLAAIVNSEHLKLTDFRLYGSNVREYRIDSKPSSWPWPEEFRNRLKRLDLGYLGPEDVKEITPEGFLPNLEFFKVHYIDINVAARLVKTMPGLKGLDLGAPARAGYFPADFPTPEGLVYLNLRDRIVGSAEANAVAANLKPVTGLKKLNVVSMYSAAAAIIMKGLPGIEEWEVSSILEPELVTNIAEAINPNVTSLKIRFSTGLEEGSHPAPEVFAALEKLQLPKRLRKLDIATILPDNEDAARFTDILAGKLTSETVLVRITISPAQATSERKLNAIAASKLSDDATIILTPEGGGIQQQITAGQVRQAIESGATELPPLTGTPFGASLAAMTLPRQDQSQSKF